MVLLLFASSANAQTFSGLISEWKADGNTLDSGISYAGLRAYTADADGSVRILPIVTPGDAKDHR